MSIQVTHAALIKMERVARIELAASAWKAEVLPLYDTRKMVEGDGFEPSKLTRQIYNLLPLATREPLQKQARNFAAFDYQCQLLNT